MMFKFRTWRITLICLSVISILLGSIAISYVDDVYRLIVNEYMIMSPQSVRYIPWRKSMYPLTFRVYLFNWTNPEEFRSGIKPRLVEMGPYTYSEYDEKVDLQWHENNTVSYQQNKLWYFDPERSNGTLDDLVTTVDIVSLTVASIAEKESFLFRRFVSTWMAIHSCQEQSTHTVGELLFAGYEDRLLNTLSSVSYFTSSISNREMFPYTKFGYFYDVNGSATAEGTFNMATGADDISQVGLIKRWNYSNRTKYFPGDCGVVQGTSGELWPPWMTKTDTISLFAKGLCSSLHLEFETEAEVEGLTGYRYVPGPTTFDNGSARPDSRCYCTNSCVPSGVLNIAACKFGSPMYLSFPHFYGADPHYVRQVDGVRPDERRHKFSITVEPNTGVPLEIFGRTQFNLMLETKSNSRMFQDVPTVLLPVMWVEVEWRLCPEKAAELLLLVGVKQAMRIGCLVLLALGAVTASVSILLPALRLRATEVPDAAGSKPAEKENKITTCNDIPMEVCVTSGKSK